MPNMKPGQLGRITSKAQIPDAIDKIVRVTTPNAMKSLLASELMWNLEDPFTAHCPCGTNCGNSYEVVVMYDAWLQPIADDQPGEDETLKWAPVPEGVPA